MNGTPSLRVKKGGTVQSVLGIILMLIPLIMRLVKDRSIPFSMSSYLGWGVLALVFSFGLFVFIKAIHKRVLAGRLGAIAGLFDAKNRVPMEVAANAAGVNYSMLVQDIRAMQKLGLARGLYADLIRKDLVYTGEKLVAAPPDDGDSASRRSTLREEHKAPVAPLYLLGLTWVVYSLFFPMYHPTDYVIILLLSLIVFFLAKWNLPQRTVIIEVPAEKPQPVSTGNDALDEMLEGVGVHISNLRRLDKAIDGKLDEPVAEILRITEQIVEQVKKHPQSSGEMRQFFNYTLPTTIGLLQNYDELSRQPVQGENIASAMWRIESAMRTIVDAFRRQHDALFKDKALDIDIELEVMQQMIGVHDIAKTLEDFKENHKQ